MYSNATLLSEPLAVECGYHPGELQHPWQMIECYRPMIGQFLRVDQLKGGEGTRLALYELLIYGY